MYVKLINPKTHGKAAYNNEESCAQTLNYLVHEAKEEGGSKAIFFNQNQDKISPDEVQKNIDSNCKGLRKQEAKFYSLIISPSESELLHIKNSEQLLKGYTRNVMQLYAQNFRLKDDRKLESNDLIWYSAIHHEREYRGTDPEVLAGKAAVGEKRPGLQTHVHVVVSARNRDQEITLNPGGRRSRFNLVQWQQAAGQQFEKQFNYIAQEKEKVNIRPRDNSRDAARAVRIAERVAVLNVLLPRQDQLDANRVQQIGYDREFDKTFYRSLKHLEQAAYAGIPLNHPYHLLKTGKEKGLMPRKPQVQARNIFYSLQAAIHAGESQTAKTEDIGERKGKQKGEIQID